MQRLSGMTMMWALATVLIASGVARGVSVSIYDLQYTTNPTGASTYEGSTVDCYGGVVIHKFEGYRTRVWLYDPQHADGWGGIVAKDFSGADAFGSVALGDWVSLSGVLVEEYRGNTQLAIDNALSVSVTGTGNSLPGAVDVGEVGFVEAYEAMPVSVSNVTVTAMDLGAKEDNYRLHNTYGDCWASDYMNTDAEGPYHAGVSMGRQFTSVSGILEQYEKETWDYLQLLTLDSGSFVPEPTSLLLLTLGALGLRRRRKKS